MKQQYNSNVLIVDDLRENLDALSKIIEQDGRTIYPATSGEEALSLLLKHEFALAILDVMMPNMNGFELAQLMRSTERTSQIPIIFVSAAGREMNYAFKGYETGAVDFLHKPLDIGAVRSKVNVFVALHQQRQEMKHQVAELQKMQYELHKTQLELRRALEMRDEFISVVAHELRTPLNTLHLEAQTRQMLLEKKGATAFTAEKLKSMVERDSRQIQNMNRLISDMVDVSRIQSGKLSLAPQNIVLAPMLRRIVADLSQQAEAAACIVDLRIDEDVHDLEANFDEFRLEQVVINLLTNAFRYGAGKPVTVSLGQTGNSLVVSVRDQGNGIAEAEQQRIFEKFERVGSSRVKEGLGMGLYIARQLTEAQGGKLEVQSRLGEGATFRIVLPVTKAQSAVRSTASSAAG